MPTDEDGTTSHAASGQAAGLLAAILERVEHAVAAFDADLRLTFANRSYVAILDLPDELQRPGTVFDDIIRHNARLGAYGVVPDEPALERTVVHWRSRALDGLDRIDEIRRPDGRTFRIEKAMLPGGGFFLTYFDITELARQKDELAAKTRQLETILQHMAQGLSIVDRDMRLIIGNDIYRQLYGFPDALATSGRDARELIRFRLLGGERIEEGESIEGDLEAMIERRLARLAALEVGQTRRYIDTRPDGRIIEVSRQRLRSGEIISLHTDITESERARGELEASERYYRSMLDDQLELVCRFDGDLRARFSNRAHAAIYDETPESIIGMHFLESVPDHLKDELLQQVRGLTPAHPTIEGENEKYLPSGEMRWYAWTNRGFFDETGRLIGLQSVGRDVTERRQMELALRTSEMRFRSIVEDQTDLICRFDHECRLTFANPAYLSVHGVSRDAAIGKSFLPRLAEPVRERLRRQLHALSPTTPLLRSEREPLRRPDGEIRWIEWTNRALFDEDGRFLEFQAIGRDVSDAYRQEMSLRQSEARYRAIVDDQSEMISRFDRDYRLTFVNSAYCRTFGKTREALIGSDLTAVLPSEEARAAFQRAVGALRPENPVLAGEYLERTGDGAFRWHHWTDRAIFDERGEVVSYQAVGRDVTERRRAEEALRKSEAQFRTIVEDQDEYILRFTPADFRITFVNEAFCRSVERERDQILGTCLFDLLGAEHEALLRGSLARLRVDEPTSAAEIGYLNGEGARIFEHWTHRGLFDGEGRLVELQSVGRDITEQAIGREALKRSERHFKSIAEAHPVPVLIIRLADQAILHASPAAVPMLGPDVATICRQKGESYLADEAQRRRFLETLEASGSVDQLELVIRAADGRRVPAEITARLVDYEGHKAFAIGIVDIGERRRAEEEIARQRAALAQSEKMSALGSLLASVAHELNNPLAIILGQAQLMEELGGDPKSMRRASRIRTAADRCARIVKTFLAMARQRPPSRATVDLAALARAAVELTGYALRTADIALDLDLPTEPIEVQADEDQLTQVLVNLLINAQQALAEISPPRRLTLRAEATSGGQARLVVVDNGPGVPEALRARIFEPFFTTKPEGMGTGIGLSVCDNIVKSHGGSIRVETASAGGACFLVELPLRNEGASEGTAANGRQMAAPIAGSRLLVVDDEEDIARTIADMLEADGHRIELARSGRAALAVIEQQPFDAIISDVRMPGLDGPGLHAALVERHPTLACRIGFVTGDTLSPSVRRFLAETGRPVMEKPFDVDDLRRLLGEILR